MKHKEAGASPQSKTKALKKKVIIGTVCGVAVLAVGLWGAQQFLFIEESNGDIQTAIAQKGDISNSISGSGTLEPKESYDVVPLVQGDILADYITEGQTIEKGDLLYRIDDSEMESNIEKSKLSLEKTQLSNQEVLDSLEDLTVISDATGNVTEMFVEKGDEVQQGAQIATIVDNSTAIVSVPFIPATAANLYVGQEASVLLEDNFATLYGTVTRIASGSRVIEDYIAVTDVEITIENPGNVAAGQTGIVTVGDYGTPYSGTFSYGSEKTITAKASGTISELNIDTGDAVKEGDIVAKLTSESAETSQKNSNISLRESQISLENLYDQLDNYNITSPISGTVIQKNSKAGDTIESSSKTVMAVIADMSEMTFTINVDELDISKIEVGQEVTVTADAQEGKTFTGYVDNVSVVGTSSNGVTTYPVKVVLKDYGDLLPGMNVNASIVIEESKDALLIPVSALNRGNFVAVKGASQTASSSDDTEKGNVPMPSNAPDGFAYVQVETGITNDDYVEILSGLDEGAEVLLNEVVTQNNNIEDMMMPGGGAVSVTMDGGGPGGGGEPPAGAPNGGMPGQ